MEIEGPGIQHLFQKQRVCGARPEYSSALPQHSRDPSHAIDFRAEDHPEAASRHIREKRSELTRKNPGQMSEQDGNGDTFR